MLLTAGSSSASSATFRLLNGAMGAKGVSLIYELSQSDEISASVKKYARQLLYTEKVRANASPALLLILDFTIAKSCDEHFPLVKRAAVAGDKRALVFLNKLLLRKDCDKGAETACPTCASWQQTIQETIATIEQRATLGQRSVETPSQP